MQHYNLGLLFSEVASAHPNSVALALENGQIEYSHLSGLTWQLAYLLKNKGCTRGSVIAIGHTKSTLSFALMIACLRMGVAYVNIDVTSPVIRLAKILKTSGAGLLFCDDENFAPSMAILATESQCELVHLREDQIPSPAEKEREALASIMRAVDGATIAYIMFTSGSTGVPKGVAVTHQNVLHFISWGQERFTVSPEDNFANLSPMYFDNSVFDFYIGLFSGATLTPVSRELLASPYDLMKYMSRMSCSIWFSVPSLLIFLMTMKALSRESLSLFRWIIFGGEGYPKPELKKLFDMRPPPTNLVNVYGPTECTCICSAHTITDHDFDDLAGLPTLGQLNPNFDYKIIDQEGNEAISGELCLIGPNVAAGYFNDIERTNSSFFTIHESNCFMKRLYRTGDLVKKENENLYFIGRKDNQIKHMGYRIELEEIEAAINGLDGVDQAAVVYQRSNVAYGKIIACIATTQELDTKQLLTEIGQRVPDYMVPHKIVTFASLPKNANGKVDRRKLQDQL